MRPAGHMFETPALMSYTAHYIQGTVATHPQNFETD
jgi:hypothetical protein